MTVIKKAKKSTSRNYINFLMLGVTCLAKRLMRILSSSKLKSRKRFGREKGSRFPDDEEYMSAQVLVSSSDFKKVKCLFCGKSHETVKCAVALNKTG